MATARGGRNEQSDTYLANRVESWSLETMHDQDPYVIGLIAALRTQTDRNSWLSLDPDIFLPHSPNFSLNKLQRLILIVNVLRNSFVFLPVALTWLAISKATNAFSLYAKTNSLNIINFLDFWQNGYGVLDRKWSISHIASIDFQIILLVILLTLLSSWLSQKWQTLRANNIKQFNESRKALALEISVHAHRTVLKNLKNFRARAAEELALKMDGRTIKKLRSYEP